MLAHSEDWYRIVDQIQKDFQQSSEKKIIIFSSSGDCDSIYSSRLLWRLLSLENIAYTLQPVSTVTQIQQICQQDEYDEDQPYRTYIFINCCGSNNIRKLFNIPSPSVRVIVFDSIRPIHHSFNNKQDNLTIFVLSKTDPQQQSEVLNLNLDKTQSRESALQDIDNEYKQAAYYCQGSFYGKPSTCVLNECAQSQGRQLSHLLQWLTICALTESYIFNKISNEQYAEYYMQLEQQVKWSNSQVENQVQDGGWLPGKGQIKPNKDYEFWLYRHRSLYESLKYSPFVASRFQTWKEKGVKQLEYMIIKIGIPLQQTHQNYYTMSKAYRSTLDTCLKDNENSFGLDRPWFPSFEYKSKSQIQIGPTDYVLLTISSLIFNESSYRKKIAVAQQQVDNNNPKQNLKNQDNVADGNKENKLDQDRGVDKFFWKTIECLDFEKVQEQKESIQHAILLVRAIVEEGGLIVSKKEIQGGHKSLFWSVNLSEQKFINQEALTNQLSLRLLGIFLQNCKAITTGGTYKDLILVSPEDDDRYCWVLAILGGIQESNQSGSTLVYALQQALKKTRAKHKQVGFDSFKFKVHVSSINDFLVSLDEIIKEQHEQKQYIIDNG